jgi:hypothetical protein
MNTYELNEYKELLINLIHPEKGFRSEIPLYILQNIAKTLNKWNESDAV